MEPKVAFFAKNVYHSKRKTKTHKTKLKTIELRTFPRNRISILNKKLNMLKDPICVCCYKIE